MGLWRVREAGQAGVAASDAELKWVDSDHADAIALSAALDEEVATRYADVSGFPAPTPLDRSSAARDLMLMFYAGGTPLGLGALRPVDALTAEIKHVFVVPAVRRRGIGRRLLTELETRARGLGYEKLRLDTGNRQFEAIGLYLALGYRDIVDYNGTPGAERWFEKILDSYPN